MTQIIESKYGAEFLLEHAKSLLSFARNSVSPLGGFGYLDAMGKIDAGKPRETYQQARFIQVYGIAHLMGLGDYQSQLVEGLNTLNIQMHDSNHGGYFNSINPDGSAASGEKLCYDHVFVLLAAVMGVACGVKEADETLAEIDTILERFFWDENFLMMKNHWDNDFKELDSYRGMNANMHAVEALLAAYDVTKQQKYFDRAYAIAKRSIDGFARNNPKSPWLLPEHFNSDWEPELAFNAESPADPFRPYGVTIGHLFEWSRLLVQMHHGLNGPEHEWMLEGARGLYTTATKYGWAPDGAEGFVYTLDWDTTPITHARMWWVPAEAVLAAYCLNQETGEQEFIDDYLKWWSYIDESVIDHVNGSWFAELDQNQKVVSNTWEGKPDVYHSFQAAVLPLLPNARSFVGAAMLTNK